MSLPVIHAGLANTAALFLAAIGVWALYQRIRSKPLGSSWFGAMVIAEVLLLIQSAIGTFLYFQGFGAALPRPFIHILYGTVSIITLPAAYGYFGSLEDENVTSLAMAVVSLFLWGVVLRATSVANSLPPYLQ